MTAKQIAQRLVERNVRLDDDKIKSCQVTINFKKHYKFAFNGETFTVPASELVSAYWDAINSSDATAFEL